VVADKRPLLDLLGQLKNQDYNFVAVTPATHALVLARAPTEPLGLRDIFGWNRPFDPADLQPGLLASLRAGGAIEAAGRQLRSTIRVASLGNDLLLHSKFPTDEPNAVFLGPDTYRFVRFVREYLPRLNDTKWIVDMGAGSGAGGIVASQLVPSARVTLVDVNPDALALARVNAAAADVEVETLQPDRIPSGANLVIANPPYMYDPDGRAYRHGGSLLGGAVALDWVEQALQALAPGGAMLLYSGAAVTDGTAPLIAAVQQACDRAGAIVTIEELDPDVFGEELASAAYRSVERIFVIGAVIQRP
jgi:SAM-dependent methyltransferase